MESTVSSLERDHSTLANFSGPFLGIRFNDKVHRASFAKIAKTVVIRFTSSGTQRGEFAGIAPSGKKVTIHEAAIYRVVAGKIVEQWGFPDSQSLMQQLTPSAITRLSLSLEPTTQIR